MGRSSTAKKPEPSDAASELAQSRLSVIELAKELGNVAEACRTPVRSPERNGIAEAFVKTPKRFHVTPLQDAVKVLGLIAGWIEDYNDNYSHSGPKMRSPRDFIEAQTATA